MRTRRELAHFVVNRIKSLGLEKRVDQSRFGVMFRAMQHDDEIQPSDPDYEIICEAERDLQMLALFFDHWDGSSPGLEDVRQCFERALADPALPQDRPTHSPGRDFSTEVFVAGVCLAAGFKNVSFDEPDVRGNALSEEYGFAVKRPKNIGKLLKHIAKAASQIEGSQRPGLIVVNVTAFNSENVREQSGIPDQELARQHFEYIHKLANDHEQAIVKATRGKNVLGVVFHDLLVRIAPSLSLLGGASEDAFVDFRTSKIPVGLRTLPPWPSRSKRHLKSPVLLCPPQTRSTEEQSPILRHFLATKKQSAQPRTSTVLSAPRHSRGCACGCSHLCRTFTQRSRDLRPAVRTSSKDVLRSRSCFAITRTSGPSPRRSGPFVSLRRSEQRGRRNRRSWSTVWWMISSCCWPSVSLLHSRQPSAWSSGIRTEGYRHFLSFHKSGD